MLERRVPSRPVSDEHDVIVGIDKPGDYGSAFQVDPADAAGRADVIAYRRKPAVLNQSLRKNSIIGVHRMDLAVHQEKVFGRLLLREEG